MKTEYAVGNIRLHFESRASRRWFVALVYAMFAVGDLAGFSVNGKTPGATWISSGFLIVAVTLMIIFTAIAGDMRARGDKREMHRRDHAHFLAYRFFSYLFVAALFAGYLTGPNPITPLLPAAVQAFVAELPKFLVVAAIILYITMPQAILLWTEPDMEEAQG